MIEGNMGKNRINYDKVHGFKEKNEAAERILDFVSAYELATVNTFLRKIKEYYIQGHHFSFK